jgi:hypothetical protein
MENKPPMAYALALGGLFMRADKPKREQIVKKFE